MPIQYLQVITNPFSGVDVVINVSDCSHRIQSQPWPDDVVSALSGQCDTDEEWLAEAIRMVGPEQAGVIILGS